MQFVWPRQHNKWNPVLSTNSYGNVAQLDYGPFPSFTNDESHLYKVLCLIRFAEMHYAAVG